jgi:predicted nuclease with TOPRIM domain
MSKHQKDNKSPHLSAEYSGMCGGKEESIPEALDALRAEVAELVESQQTLNLAFRTLENRYDALETLLRHMQAAKLGHGPSAKNQN